MKRFIFLSSLILIFIIGFICADTTIGSIYPKKTAIDLVTEFQLTLYGDDADKYFWDFGDNSSIETTSTNKITHIYEKIGSYNLGITIEDSSGVNSSKYFIINVVDAKEFAKENIEEKESKLNNLISEIKTLGEFEQGLIEKSLGIDDIKEKIKEAQIDYSSSTSNEVYNSISEELVDIKIPSNIALSKEAIGIKFFPQTKVIEVDIVEEYIGGYYEEGEEEDYAERIKTWQYTNLDVEMDFKEISGVYDIGEERLARLFSIDIDAKEELNHTPYVIIKDLEGLSFKGINPEDQSGYYVIEMQGNSMTLDFSTTEDFEFSDLPLFISPNLDYLETTETPTKRNVDFDWFWFWIIIILILLISLVLYIFLQEWYKRKYESYLFKNRNDLYNLIVYVKKSKEKGFDEGKIRKKLREQKWSNEQIDYVLKKYAGKRTGMIEIPISKLIDKIMGLFHKEEPKNKLLMARGPPPRKI